MTARCGAFPASRRCATGQSGPRHALAASLKMDPNSTEAYDLVPEIRARARSADPKALVGGTSAVEHDLREASTSDTKLLVPLTLVIVFVILGLLLRALVAPVVLIGTVVLTFVAALGSRR